MLAMDVKEFSRIDALATDATVHRLGPRPAQDPWFVGFLSAASCAMLLSVFATFADVRDRTEPLIWIFCLAVGAVAFFLTRYHRDRWFRFQREAFDEIKRSEAPSRRSLAKNSDDAPSRPKPTEFQMPPEEHQRAAVRLRIEAAHPGADKEWAERIARNHEVIAEAIDKRQGPKSQE